jgi:hypothetical protein
MFDVAATLTNGSGWHTTIQLVSVKVFTGKSHDATVTLDLDALDARATAAAKAIGIEPGAPITIALNARVSATGRHPFTAPLRLQMNSLQLTLTNGNSLVVDDAGSAAPVAKVARQIKLFNYSIMTASQARSYAVLLLLATAVGGAAVALAARRSVPLRSRPEIERRYAQLLVPVEPMASPPGKPVVNVDNFPALVRLAERYGQMILTWSRPEADDFVVRDEGITYRYRIPLAGQARQNVDDIDRPPTAGSHRRTASSPLP